jgi:small-conductance mechanosensitive channel
MGGEQFAIRAREILAFGIPGTPFTFGKLIVLAILLTLLFHFNRRVTRWVVDSLLARRQLNVGVQIAVSTLVRYAVATVGVLVILEAIGIDLAGFAVLAGAVGVGLGFGLQNVTSNFVSGLIILIERPIKVGDRIEIGSISGEVRRIGARATTVVTQENIAVIVPNSQFISELVTNWSHTGPLTAFVVRMRMPWRADAEAVREVMLEVAHEHPHVLSDPAPEVELLDLRNGMHFALQVWSNHYLQGEARLKSELNFAIRQKLREREIEAAERAERDPGLEPSRRSAIR